MVWVDWFFIYNKIKDFVEHVLVSFSFMNFWKIVSTK